MEYRTCRVCGCTDVRACPGGCWRVEVNLCSSCRPARPTAAPADRAAGTERERAHAEANARQLVLLKIAASEAADREREGG